MITERERLNYRSTSDLQKKWADSNILVTRSEANTFGVKCLGLGFVLGCISCIVIFWLKFSL